MFPGELGLFKEIQAKGVLVKQWQGGRLIQSNQRLNVKDDTKELIMQFTVETESTIVKNVKKRELIQQIESLQRFYYELGHDSDNIKTIFSLTLSYLKGHVNQLLVRSFFDVLMAQSRLKNGKELNLLNCFDSLIDDVESGGFKAQAEDTQLELSLREAA